MRSLTPHPFFCFPTAEQLGGRAVGGAGHAISPADAAGSSARAWLAALDEPKAPRASTSVKRFFQVWAFFR